MKRIGIDLGGTKIELVALDENGHSVWRERIAAPRGDYRATLDALVALVQRAEQRLGETASLGIGIPGAESLVSGLIKNANSTWLIGQPLRQDLQDRLQREVRLANDANCFTLSEAVDGAGAGAASVFGVILGTGVGGGIVIHGRILVGANAIAGEWGHNPLPGLERETPPYPACYCGRLGCIETYLSGPALSADHALHHGEQRTARELAQAAAAGDQHARASLHRYCGRLARALAGVINLLDPEVIVLGGGLSQIPLIYQVVPELWGEFIFSDQVRTRLLPPRWGDASGVRGAAWLWPPC
ncbi:MAG: hypothetical protein RIR00_399 [Pseudomonadota bacterium]|jgi:fructokinase